MSYNAEENYMDEYVVGIQNPTQLVSSLALMLKERNYVCLYDTNVLSSPEPHIKKSSFSELNPDFLYKWFLFFTGLSHNLRSYANLIIIPEVAEEMLNLISATLSSMEKKKNSYHSLPPQEKEQFQEIYKQILKNEDILNELQKKLEITRNTKTSLVQTIYDHFLDLIMLLDEHLELKKPTSRGGNDTDERLACQTFYEIAVNNHNVAVYTRDDDIRKLISATFKFLLSHEIQHEDNIPFLKNFSYLNLVVLKYNYEKRVFSRFFESSTLPYSGEFRFPPRFHKSKVAQIIATAQEILHKIQEELRKIQQLQTTAAADTVVDSAPKLTDEKVFKAIHKILENIAAIKIPDQDAVNYDLKITALQNLAVLADYCTQPELVNKILETKQKYQRTVLENTIAQIKRDQDLSQKQFDQLRTAQNQQGMEYWEQIHNMAEAIRENLIKLSFFESALRTNLEKVTPPDYENFKKLLVRFHQSNFSINEKETPVPYEKIAEITGLPIREVIQVIENAQIKHQTTHAYLTQRHLILFLFPHR